MAGLIKTGSSESLRGSASRMEGWFHIPPWIILGAVLVLGSIFIFWTVQNINMQKENATRLLLEKGAALIRSFEAGTRTGMRGMMGMRGSRFQLQTLLTETAQEPDIDHLLVADTKGVILAHSDPEKIGGTYGNGLDLGRIAGSEQISWRVVPGADDSSVFEVFRRFSPTGGQFSSRFGMRMHDFPTWFDFFPQGRDSEKGLIIFVGLDMDSIETARRADVRHTLIMAGILLLVGFAGIFSLFLVQAFRSTKSSLSRIKAFSDNLVENMPMGLLAIDAEGRIVTFNQTAEIILGRPAQYMLGKPAEMLPEDLRSLAGELDSEREMIVKEIELEMDDGRRIPLDASISSLRGEKGTFLGSILLFRDMTEMQALKKEVERNQRLASLGRLAAGVAHEIRNPLSSIKGFATYFKERYRGHPEDQKTAEIMIQEVDRLNRVIGQLLEFARPLSIQKRPVPAGELIRRPLKIVEGQAREKGIRIETEIAALPAEVPVDPDRMNQVMLNLYLNAVEAMEQGGILSVTLSPDGRRAGVRIRVSDTGCGISKGDLSHVFEPYFTTKPSGTGLGLAIVHNIVESHKGEVSVESEPGKGTTVSILLPLD